MLFSYCSFERNSALAMCSNNDQATYKWDLKGYTSKAHNSRMKIFASFLSRATREGKNSVPIYARLKILWGQLLTFLYSEMVMYTFTLRIFSTKYFVYIHTIDSRYLDLAYLE